MLGGEAELLESDGARPALSAFIWLSGTTAVYRAKYHAFETYSGNLPGLRRWLERWDGFRGTNARPASRSAQVGAVRPASRSQRIAECKLTGPALHRRSTAATQLHGLLDMPKLVGWSYSDSAYPLGTASPRHHGGWWPPRVD